MGTGETSLRSQVEKWLAPTPANPPRVSRFGRTVRGARYVCVETLRLAGPVMIVFFHHDDGAWRVFPPDSRRLGTSGAFQRAA